ncbi:MAG: hypothetical protein L3K17_03885 [Thermoplasmata archaeon]|nr:hypothetical protein [Thermoplasmata archaeon]
MTLFGIGGLTALPWTGIALGGLLLGAIAAWWLASRVREPAAPIRLLPQTYPNRDPVSVAVEALESGRYTRLLERARTQLSAFSVRETGRPLDNLPGRWTGWRTPASPGVRTVRRMRGRLDQLRRRADWRKRSWLPRADVWRSSAASSARFQREIATLLADQGKLVRSRETA